MGGAQAGMMVTPSVRLVRPLGEGGMGHVWVAEHLALRTQVVVKFIASELQNSREALDRFSREAAAAAQVKSPHVVQTFDHGVSEGGVPYIVMELLEGRDLGAHLQGEGDTGKRLPPELVLEIVAQLSRALERAHERGIVHRDIKPGNIFLCDAGNGDVFVKLLDFGIAKGVDVPTLDSHTKTGSMIGSPFYMSPEQILGSREMDHRTDLWSLGVVTFEALTGVKPFDAETMGGLAIKIHSEPLPKVTRYAPDLPPAVDAWFERACARSPAERFRSARELAEALAGALGGQMPRSQEVPRVGSDAAIGMAPTLATTEAGIVKPASPVGARSKVLGVVAIAALGVVSFVAARAIRTETGRGQGLVSEPSAALRTVNAVSGAATPAPPPSAEPIGHAAPPVLTAIANDAKPAVEPDVVPATASARGNVSPAPARPSTRPRPQSPGGAITTSLPSPSSSPPPRPASSIHDIY